MANRKRTTAPAKPEAKPEQTAADKAVERKAQAAERAAASKAKAEATKAAKVADRASRPCECGCGGVPTGFKSRFIPGHDARVAARLMAAIKNGQIDASLL
jgi:hypothetical protein